MTYFTVELAGEVFFFRVLEEAAPRTCQALWEALPFDNRAVHSTWSGNMIGLLDPAPVPVSTTEDPVGFQYPGLLVFYPERREIAICYGDARFRGAARAEYVTPVAELVGDVDRLADVAATLQFAGATPIRFRRADVAPPPAPAPTDGARIQVDLDGAVVTAVLLESSAPRTCAAFTALLPLEGQATNTKWSGPMCHFWGRPDRASRGSIGLHVDPLENPTLFHWPGYIYYFPGRGGLRIPCGDAQMGGAFRSLAMTPFARFEDNWSAFREKGRRLYITGARPMRIRRLD